MSRSFFSSQSCLEGCDRLITGGILFLVLFTPLAFGAVHPWAFSLMEVVIFLLVLVWMGKQYCASGASPSFAQIKINAGEKFPNQPRWWLFFPVLLFVSLIFLQLLPMPPALLRLVSPETYELYATSLPGWPDRAPYSVTLEGPGQQTRSFTSTLSLWRSLSISPELTRTDLLKLLAYCSLFFLVLLYPFESSSRRKGEEHFYRVILLTVLISGVLVACIGVLQRFTWNGQILWFFIPYDWGAARPADLPHATGPFINHPPFANYLALIFPLALVGLLAKPSFVFRGKERAFRLFCGITVLILLIGILLSLSRGGWIGIGVGGGLVYWLFLRLPQEKRPAVFQRPKFVLCMVAAGMTLVLSLILFSAGAAGRQQVDVRLERTLLEGQNLWVRLAIGQDTLGMVRDFPLFGVGLGAWPELFPRYQRPPWFNMFVREAHNDYVELLAETGGIGFALLAWFFWRIGRRLFQELRTVSSQSAPVFAALLASFGVMVFHEFFDFSLQIPANAFLFTLFLGLALRLIGVGSSVALHWSPRYALGTGGVACVLLVFSLFQESIPYPHNLKEPASLVEAKILLSSHPARASTHRALFLLQEEVPLSQRLEELQIALWLEPTNPYFRDLYAASLIQLGRQEAGLQQISQSIASSPSLSTHWYLDQRWRAQLSLKEQQAVEEGYKHAIATGFREAVWGLGTVYWEWGRFAARGRLYEEAAHQDTDPERQLSYFLAAGRSHAKSGNDRKAETLLRQAAELIPHDPKPYQYMVWHVFGPRGDIEAAQAVVATGIKQGVDPFVLYMDLGNAAHKAQQGEAAKSAFQQALAQQPASFDALYRLGRVYLQEKSFGQAAVSFRKAVESDPSSASAFYHLGEAEEKSYRFFEAKKAYDRAVELEPDNVRFQQRHQALLQKLILNSN